MTESIRTARQIYSFNPIPLRYGRKRINTAVATENLLAAHSLLVDSGIRWGIVFGTLLGAVRDSSFIQHDEDTDVFVFAQDRKFFLSLIGEFREAGFEIARYEGHLLSLIRKGDYIDFYFFRRTISGRRSGNLFIPKSFFLARETLPFIGRTFPTVSSPAKFLEHTYGSDWRTPKVGHHAPEKPNFFKKILKERFPRVFGFLKAAKRDGGAAR
jgi:hypothetical protein